MDARSSRSACAAAAADRKSDSTSGSNNAAGRSSEPCAGSSNRRDHTTWLSSKIRGSRWMTDLSWARRSQPQQQHEYQSFLSRVFRKTTVEDREQDGSRNIRGGRPTFERRRRRYRTVSWKYKKSIGFLASFVFLCNQILAPGLMSMPLTLIEYGWLPSLLVNLLFCLVSTLCSLLLLRSVTLIEGNQNFDERFEYSATLRHFFSPPGADMPSGGVVTRGTAASAAKAAATRTSEALSAEKVAGFGDEKTASHSPIWKFYCICKRIWNPRRALAAEHKCLPAKEDGRPASALSAGMPGGRPLEYTTIAREAQEGKARRKKGIGISVFPYISRFITGRATNASQTCTDVDGEELSGPDQAACHSNKSQCSEHETNTGLFHPSDHTTSTRDSDLRCNPGGDAQVAASPDRAHVHFAEGLHPGYLLRRALYSLRLVLEYNQRNQRLQQLRHMPQAQVQHTENMSSVQQTVNKNPEASEAREGRLKEESTWQQRVRERAIDRGDQLASTIGTEATAPTASTTAARSTYEAGPLSFVERDGEMCTTRSKVRETLETSGAPEETATSPAVAGDSPAVVALLPPENSSHRPDAQQKCQRGGRLQCILTPCRMFGRMQRRVIAVLLSPFWFFGWLCGIPHRLMQCLYRAMVRPPPLLPSSFPRLLSWLLHLNTFLSTCSAALLVAYCIDCLLLRVFSCSLFVPLLPTHVSSEVGSDPQVSWHIRLGAVGHWVGAVIALLLQPIYVLAYVIMFLSNLMAAAGAALDDALAAITAAVAGNSFSGSSLADAARIAGAFAQYIRQSGNKVLLPVYRALDCSEAAAVKLVPDWLRSISSSLFSSAATGFAGGFMQEQRIAGVYGVARVPFLYVLSSQQQIEEVFSGVCSSSNNISAFCTATESSPAERYPFFSAFLAVSPATGEGSGVASSSVATGGLLSLAHDAAAKNVVECLPQCVSHMGISVGYIITAAICLHLAAADLQENARMQLLSFGAIIAAVLQISWSAALMLLHPAPATGTTSASKATNLGGATSQAAAIVSAAVTEDALAAERAVGSFRRLARLPFGAFEKEHAARGAGSVVRSAAASTVPEGSSPSSGALSLSLLRAAFCKPPTTPAAAYNTLLSSSRDTCSTTSFTSSNAAAAVADVASGAAFFNVPADAVPDAGALAEESLWPRMIVRGSGMGSLVSTFVDAYSYSNSLPSWANEVKDNIPVTRTLFMSTTFACVIYFLFGVLCAAAFPTFSASTNVLAAMLPSCHSHVAAACICFFHIFALLPNIVSSQISRRYDLLNMAICLDRPSAFYVASTMPWMLYWLLTFSPVFAVPSQLLTLLSNILLNFAAPAFVYVYALHATAPPSLEKVARVSFHDEVEPVSTGGASAPLHAGRMPAEKEAAAIELQTPDAATTSLSSTYFSQGPRYEDTRNFAQWREQQVNDDAGATVECSSWQEKRHETRGNSDPSNTKGTGVCEASSTSKMSSTPSTCLSRTSSFTYGASAPSPAQPRAELAAAHARPNLLRFRSTGGVEAVGEGGWRENSAASQVEERNGLSVHHTAGDLLIGRLAMHAVPEEEGENEDEGHAAEVEDYADDENIYPSLPPSLSHLRERNSHGSIATCSSGGMSRWSTRCFGEMRIPRTSGDERFAEEELGRTHSYTGLKRTQSQNVLSFQSRTLADARVKSVANNFVEGSLAAGGAGGVAGSMESLLQFGYTKPLSRLIRGDEALASGAGAAVTSVAGIEGSTKGEEKLGKMRVAGAVAGGGGARSREVQRQLQTWLEEYSRQMPDSEVAQLLQRQHREEQQERMRLQQQETQLKKNLRKQVESQWRRQQIFRTEEDRSPSPRCSGAGSSSHAGAVLEMTVDQNRSSSLPPYARGGDAATAEGNAAPRNAGTVPHHDGIDVFGHPMLRRRSSRSLSYGRRLLQPSVGRGDTTVVTSAVGDGELDTNSEAGAATGLAEKTFPVAALPAHVGASGLAAVGGRGGGGGRPMADSSEQGYTAASGFRRSTHSVDALSVKGENAAAVEAPTGDSAGTVAHKQRPEEPQQRRRRSSNHISGDSVNGTSRSATSGMAGGAGQSGVAEAAAAAIACASDGTHDVDATTSVASGNSPVSSPSVVVTDGAVGGQIRQRHITQNSGTEDEAAGASQQAPTFVRRTSKRCPRIDSVSVALQQRRRQQLLKQERKQEEQQPVQRQAEEQPLSGKPTEQGKEQVHFPGKGQLRQFDEQGVGTEMQHRDQGLLCSEIHAQKSFQRRSSPHATLVSRLRSNSGSKADVFQACAAAVSDSAPAAGHPRSSNSVVAGDVEGRSEMGMQEALVWESQCANVHAGNEVIGIGATARLGSSSGAGNVESITCNMRRSTTNAELGRAAVITRYEPEVDAFAGTADLVGDVSHCLVAEVSGGTYESNRNSDELELTPALEDMAGVEGEQRQRGESEIAQLMKRQEKVKLSGVAMRRNERQDAHEVAAQADPEGSQGASQADNSTSKASSMTADHSHTRQSDRSGGKPVASHIANRALNGGNGKCKGEGGVLTTQIATALAMEKAPESSAAATDTLPAESVPRGDNRLEASDVSPQWRRLTSTLKKLQKSIRSHLLRVCCSVSYAWHSAFLRLRCRPPRRRVAEQALPPPPQQQQHLLTKTQDRVSFFPWLRSTEEQLVATYALLAVVLYSAAAALADEMWNQLEAARFYFWRYSYWLASWLWAVELRMVIELVWPLVTWVAATFKADIAQAKYLLDKYVLEVACSWLTASVRKVQRLSEGLARESERPTQQISASIAPVEDRDLHSEPEAAQIQPNNSFVDEEAAAVPGLNVPVARPRWESPAAQLSLNARAALPGYTRSMDRMEEREQNVDPSAGLSAETFFMGLLLLVACTLPLLRYASPGSRGARVSEGSRRQRAHT